MDPPEQPALQQKEDGVAGGEHAAMSQAEDGAREIRAMVLMALPCPPLPMLANRVVEGEESTVASGDWSGGVRVSNTHDLLGHLLNVRAACDQQAVNANRLRAQERAHQRLFDGLDALAAEADDAGTGLELRDVVAAFGQFTRDYVAAFLDGTASGAAIVAAPDVRILADLGQIRSTDNIYWRLREYVAAQDVLFRGSVSKEPVPPCVRRGGWDVLKDPSEMTFADLVMVCACRIIQAGAGVI